MRTFAKKKNFCEHSANIRRIFGERSMGCERRRTFQNVPESSRKLANVRKNAHNTFRGSIIKLQLYTIKLVAKLYKIQSTFNNRLYVKNNNL